MTSEDATMHTNRTHVWRTVGAVVVASALTAATLGVAVPMAADAVGSAPLAARLGAPAQARATVTARTSAATLAPVAGQGVLAGDCGDGCELWAQAGTVTVPTSATTSRTADAWAFNVGGASAAPAFSARSAVIVGTAGTTISIRLHNAIGDQRIGLSVPQLDGFAPDVVGVPSTSGSNTVTYALKLTRPGTYVYQASLSEDGARQAAMGLVGALVVRPAATANDDYSRAQSDFQDESVLVYTDLDTRFAAAPTTYNMRNYRPDFHLVNGVAYPSANSPQVTTDLGRKVMLRLVNGSILQKSPTLVGARMTVVGRGSRQVPAALEVSGRVVNPGDTLDAVLPAGDVPARFALFDAPASLSDAGWVEGVNAPALGGAVTIINVGVPPDPTKAGPAATALSVVGQPGNTPVRNLTANATLSTVGRSSSLIDGGEFWVDQVGTSGQAGSPAFPGSAAIVGLSGSVLSTVPFTFPVDTTLLSSGLHTLFLHGKDSTGAWGPFRTVQFRVDKDGPVVPADSVVLSSSTTNGSSALTFTATVDDTTTGGSNVPKTTGATAWVDGGTPVTVATNGPRIIAAASGTISTTVLAGLTEGVHTLWIRGTDIHNQPGTATPTTFTVDRRPPTTFSVALRPSATNGTSGNPAKPGTLGVTVEVRDPVSGGVSSPIDMVELYLGTTIGSAGSTSGIQMAYISTDAITGRSKYTADMPLSWIAGYATSTAVPIWAVALDTAGNRGSATVGGQSATLTIDRDKPTATAPVLVQAAFNGTAASNGTVSLTASFADTGNPSSGLASAEYFVGPDPGAGNGTPIAITTGGTTSSGTATIDLTAIGRLSGGTLAVSVRAKDAAGSWSAVKTASIPLNGVDFHAEGFDPALTGWVPSVSSGGAITVVGGSLSANVTTGSASRAYAGYDYTSLSPAVGTTWYSKTAFSPPAVATGTTTANSASSSVTVLSALASNPANASQVGNAVVVQYRRTLAGVVSFRVGVANQALFGTNPTFAYSGWQPVKASGSYALVVSYRAAASGTGGGTTTGGATLTINGTTIVVNGATTAFPVSRVRLGVITRSNNFPLTASYRFDSFASARAPF